MMSCSSMRSRTRSSGSSKRGQTMLSGRLKMPLLFVLFLNGSGTADEVAPRLDSHGDPLPPFALARLGTKRLWHQSQANSIAFSPDGKTLATVAGEIRLWDVTTGKELRRIERPIDVLKSL